MNCRAFILIALVISLIAPLMGCSNEPTAPLNLWAPDTAWEYHRACAGGLVVATAEPSTEVKELWCHDPYNDNNLLWALSQERDKTDQDPLSPKKEAWKFVLYQDRHPVIKSKELRRVSEICGLSLTWGFLVSEEGRVGTYGIPATQSVRYSRANPLCLDSNGELWRVKDDGSRDLVTQGFALLDQS